MKPNSGNSGSHSEVSRKKQETEAKQSTEVRMKAQIARNNEWIEKMSPVIKYRIQEYMRKQTSKKQQRRKFSIARGLPNKDKIADNGGKRAAKTRRVHSEIEIDHVPRGMNRSTRRNEQDNHSRRQSAPPVEPSRNHLEINPNFDMRSLEDLE